jgi:hypothetical protein
VPRYRLEHQGMVNAVEKRADIKVNESR